MRLFQDPYAAARELAGMLGFLKGENPIVLGLANGGVPVAEIIARELDAPFDVLIIERLRAPKNPSHIVGAVDEHGRISMIRSTARWHHLTSREMVDPARDIFRDIQRRRGKIRSMLPEIDVRDRTVVLVSPGVASGAKMLGAIASVRDRGAQKVVIASPAGSGEAAWQLHDAADVVVIPHRPSKFKSVEQLYSEYVKVTDEMVQAVVERWVGSRTQTEPGVRTITLKVPNADDHLLSCELDLPPGATRGSGPYPTVVFAHGFESDGRNPRTVPISRRVAKRGIIGVRASFTGHGRSQGELEEATDARMADDLVRIVAAVAHLHEVNEERVGLCGSASGGVLALELAKSEPKIRTVVVRGPMVGPELDLIMGVRVPSLMIFSEQEREFADEARRRKPELPSSHELLEIPGATRLFNDAISLEMMVGASVDWIVDHLNPIPGAIEALEAADETAEGATEGAAADPG
jgi:putative phosphoribosyl transferase